MGVEQGNEKVFKNLHKRAQRTMERGILGVTMWDQNRFTWKKARTRSKDIVYVIKQQNGDGQVIQLDKRQTNRVIYWYPYNDKHSIKRLNT